MKKHGIKIKGKKMDEQKNINQTEGAENTTPSNVTSPSDEQNTETANTEVVESDNKQPEASAEKDEQKETPAEPVSDKKAEDEQESKTVEVKDKGSKDSDKKSDSLVSKLEQDVLVFIGKALEVISKFEKYNKDVKDNSAEIKKLRTQLETTQNEVETKKKDIENLKKEHKDELKKKEDSVRESVKKEYDGKLNDKESEISRLKNEKITLKSQHDEALKKKDGEISRLKEQHKNELEKKEKEVTSKFEGQIKSKDSEIASLNKKISDNEAKHKDELAKQEKEITAKFEEQLRHYNNTVKLVPFAESYAKKLNALLEIGNKVKADAAKLTTKRMEDPYNVYKCISKCWASLAGIDMEKFETEVSLISNAKMVVKGKSGLDKYSDDTKELEVKTYFFDAYLKKYIDAIVTLNENCAGIHRLVEGLEESDTKSFFSYRQNLEKVCDDLGITVETVHLFDKAGVNSALKATSVDAGCGIDEIVEIGNSIVYMTGANRPSDKIEVKVQG